MQVMQVPDKLSLWPFYYLTFKCDVDLQPTNLHFLQRFQLKNVFFCGGTGGGVGEERGGGREG